MNKITLAIAVAAMLMTSVSAVKDGMDIFEEKSAALIDQCTIQTD